MVRPLVALIAALALGACGGSFSDGDSADDPDTGPRADDDAATGLIDYEPSNITDNHLTVGTASVTIDGDVTINSETGEIVGPGLAGGLPTGNIFVVLDQGAEAPTLGVFSWANLTITEGSTISIEGANGLVFAISANVTIDGTIDASGGRGAVGLPGPGGFVGGDQIAALGQGLGGGGSLGNRDAGGGGGGHGAEGGAGGVHEGNPGGDAGAIAGMDTNIPLFGGSGGGRGGANADGGNGGGGGGAFQISARGEIRFGAASGVNVSGAGGIGGDQDRGGGGGGAGGAILLEARYVLVDGILSANGGGGGAGANQNSKGADGMRGAFGDIAATGGTGAGEGTNGGTGAAGDVMAGLPGSPGIGNTGGGGGGAGRIFVRTREAAQLGGIVSPSAAMTIGTL